ncbi:hypothetical protein [uncultured Tessaracoccus sp.]|uniref:hypothetical protein n=1 Tax=uncultured Tessaracoccus sp. TaxID=905023 RepID=UPI0025CF7D17|nr:hypothetical protein [uncultured Tessaracoccus sp.]
MSSSLTRRSWWRVVLPTALAAALVTPVAPASGSPEAECTVDGSVAAWRPHGTAANLWGTVTGACGGATIVAEAHIGGDWVTIGTGETDADGSFTVAMNGPTERAGTHTVRARVGETSSEPDAWIRYDEPTALHTGARPVGHTTNAWGHFPGGAGIDVWTEVETAKGVWSRSQRRRADATGHYAIPLTYGANAVGTKRWRVAGAYSDGSVVRTDEFGFTREARPTAKSVGRRFVGERTYAWGRLPGAGRAQVWTEVQLPGGRWSRSQTTRTTSTGQYRLPLTYGARTVGTKRWRVVGRTASGSLAHSSTFSLTRMPSARARSTGSKLVHEGTYTWGRFPAGGARVWTEVRLPGGRWARSQVSRSRADGGFTIPLTYGAATPGAQRWRVAGHHAGRVVRSNEFTLTRRGLNVAPCAKVARAERGLRTRARNVMRVVCHEFPFVSRQLGVGGRGNASYHPTGRAVDVMVSGTRGWEVAHMLQRHASRLGVTEIIYERRIWTAKRAGEGWRWMSNRGNATANHYDHVHVSIP